MPGRLRVRNVDDELIRRLKHRVARHGGSAEAEHREILRQALAPEAERDLVGLFSKVRALSTGRPQTPSELLQREGCDERRTLSSSTPTSRSSGSRLSRRAPVPARCSMAASCSHPTCSLAIAATSSGRRPAAAKWTTKPPSWRPGRSSASRLNSCRCVGTPLSLGLALALGHPASDCHYLVLARDSPFVSADLRLVERVRGHPDPRIRAAVQALGRS